MPEHGKNMIKLSQCIQLFANATYNSYDRPDIILASSNWTQLSRMRDTAKLVLHVLQIGGSSSHKRYQWLHQL